MKKEKFALVAIAIVGVIGGSLAFKAKSRFVQTRLWYTNVYSAIPPLSNTVLATLNFAPGLSTVTVISPKTYYYTAIWTDPATTYIIYTGAR